MEKKIKDLTFGERMKICAKYENCEDCPLFAGMDYDNVPKCVDKLMIKEVLL